LVGHRVVYHNVYNDKNKDTYSPSSSFEGENF
jgi:hypothetical protein